MSPLIQVTSDYSKFRIMDVNREINKSHLKKLTASISSKNFLHLFPIIINKHFDVIEGQHRLQAAKELSLPIYYIVDNDITSRDIALVNNNRKSWAAMDYIGFYARSGNASYKHLEALRSKYPKITVTCAIKLSDNTEGNYFGGGNQTQLMREGKIECVDSALAFLIADTCHTLNQFRYYTFDPVFMLGIKKVILKSSKPAEKCCEILISKKSMLPLTRDSLETCLPILKQMLS